MLKLMDKKILPFFLTGTVKIFTYYRYVIRAHDCVMSSKNGCMHNAILVSSSLIERAQEQIYFLQKSRTL